MVHINYDLFIILYSFFLRIFVHKPHIIVSARMSNTFFKENQYGLQEEK